MFALEVEYLTGRAVAASRDDRDEPEWPPHPGRLFSAMVAAHAERDPGDGAEREALLWLEGLPAPEFHASAASRRDVPTVFVPVNDAVGPDIVPKLGFTTSLIAEKIRVLPERRSKRPRSFPSVTPESPRVVFSWAEADTDGVNRHHAALERLAAHVTYLGHSSSLVRVAPCDTPPPPTHRPDDEGTIVLRVPTPGRLSDLVAAHAAGRRPSPGFYCGYVAIGEPNPAYTPGGALGRLVAFRLLRASHRLPLVAAAKLTTTVRKALMELADQPPREVISGHAIDGSPSRHRDEEPGHIAIVPLAFVGRRHADGDIKGFAVAIPAGVSGDERVHVLRAIGRLKELTLGSDGTWSVERITGVPTLDSLRTERYYEGPALTWATVTPMVFDHFPKKRGDRDATAVLTAACKRIGLKQADLVTVEVSPVSRHAGVPMSHEFSIPVKYRRPPRPYWHAIIGFDRPVRGPIVLGAGRYLGLGLFRALDVRPGDGGHQ